MKYKEKLNGLHESIYSEVRALPEEKRWSKAVLERDKQTCQKCGHKNTANSYRKKHAHHKKSYKSNPELRLKVENGITLCDKCHKKEHRRKEKF